MLKDRNIGSYLDGLVYHLGLEFRASGSGSRVQGLGYKSYPKP